MLQSIPAPTCRLHATFTHLQNYEAKQKYPIISLLHFKGFPLMTEHIFSPPTNKQTNNGKKTKKQINNLRGTLVRK